MKEVKKVPELRFKGFEGEWEEKRLGKLGEFGRSYSYPRSREGAGEIKHIHYGDIHSHFKGYVDKNSNIPSIIVDGEHLFVEKGDIVIADASEDYKDLGKTILIRDIDDDKIIAGSHTFLFKAGEYLSPMFYLMYTQTEVFEKFVSIVGTGTSVYGISKTNLKNMNFNIPSIPEQTKIASFLSKLDEKIEIQENQVGLLEEKKRGLMQKIFSQEIRFKDEDGEEYPEWEGEKLSNLCNIATGKLDANAMVEGGRYPFFTCAREDYRIDKPAFDTEALIIAGNGDVGHIKYYKGEFNAYQRTYVLDGFEQNIIFIKNYMDRYFKDKVLKELQVGSMPYIKLGTLAEFNIQLPSSQGEQQKIANFLSKVDEKIENERDRLEELRELKKGLLQKMFV